MRSTLPSINIQPRQNYRCVPQQGYKCDSKSLPLTRTTRVRSLSDEQATALDSSYTFVAQNEGAFRSVPLWAGGFGIVSVLANRLISGIAPVVDASSSQSRTDVLGIFMAAVLLLTGLQWASLKPKPVIPVELDGREVMYVDEATLLPAKVKNEMTWCWQALKSCTRCRSMVVIYQGRNIFHAGAINSKVTAGYASVGEVGETAMKSGQGNYLANLVLYPGRAEFMTYLPEEMQGVVVQPIGKDGVLVAGTNVKRGFSRTDQAWIATLADKLEVSLEGVSVAKPGVGFKGKKK